MTNTVAMPIPPALDPGTLTDARFTMRVDGQHGQALLHYDPARRIGATFLAEACVWALWWPMSFDQFLAGIARFQPREAPGFAAWAAACDPTGTASRTQ